jgi:hypothetical protein
VNLNVAADPNGADIIGNFQNYQLSHNGDPCSYKLTAVSTFGPDTLTYRAAGSHTGSEAPAPTNGTSRGAHHQACRGLPW